MTANQPPGPEHPAGLDRAREDLDGDAGQIDAATRSRLNRARQAALAQLDSPRPPLAGAFWWRSGMAAAAGCALVAVLWLNGGNRDEVLEPFSINSPEPLSINSLEPLSTDSLERFSKNSFADSELLGDQADPEFFDDLEFYRWLAREGMGDDKGADNHDA